LLTYPNFHLEDKVSLEDPGNDMNEAIGDPTNTGVVMNPQSREKRNVGLPSHLKDYELPTWRKNSKK
jgi:hypothetical protein